MEAEPSVLLEKKRQRKRELFQPFKMHVSLATSGAHSHRERGYFALIRVTKDPNEGPTVSESGHVKVPLFHVKS